MAKKEANLTIDPKKAIIVDLPKLDPKKHSVRFETDNDEEPLTNVYVKNPGIESKLGGAKKGVKVIIVAL